MALKSKHAFGSEANVDSAIEQGAIDAYDILFLDEKKIGWIDKDGNKVILEDKEQVKIISELPSSGETDVLYVCGMKFYTWDNNEFHAVSSGEGGVDETVVDVKIEEAKKEITAAANAYTDEKISEYVTVVEF